jgi:DNA-binding MarR family transcriptional regulator
MADPSVAVRLPIDDSLFFKLVRLVNLTARPFVETLARTHHLSLNEWRAMLVLASHPGVAAREVADHTGLDKMSVSRALAALDRQGRLVKAPDPADARRTQLWLSADGQALFETIARPAVQREAQLYAPLTAEELAQMHSLVDRLAAAL